MKSALTGTDTTVANSMHAGVISCSVETPLAAVAGLMARHQIHAVVVYDYGDEPDEDRQLYGIVSDRDIAEAYAAEAVDGRTAGDSAGEPILAVESDEELRRAAQLLAEHGVSHLVVTDPHTQRPVGVLSTLDLARSISA
jgi:CBS domain-containing protein